MYIANFSQICSTQAGYSGYDELSIGFEPIINKKYFEGIMQYKLHQCPQFLQLNEQFLCAHRNTESTKLF